MTSFSLDYGTLDSPMVQKLYFLGSFVDEVSHVTQLSPNWLQDLRKEGNRVPDHTESSTYYYPESLWALLSS